MQYTVYAYQGRLVWSSGTYSDSRRSQSFAAEAKRESDENETGRNGRGQK